MSRIVFYALTKSSFFHHFNVKISSFFNSLSFNKFSLFFKIFNTFFHFCFNGNDCFLHFVRSCDVVWIGEYHNMISSCNCLSSNSIYFCDFFYFITPEFNSDCTFSIIRRKYFDNISFSSKSSAFKVKFISAILHTNKLF